MARLSDCRTGSIVIRRLREADLAAVNEIESRSFSTPWPEESFRRLVHDPLVWAVTARCPDGVIGYLIGLVHSGRFLIANLAVDQSYRRRGVARSMLSAALTEAGRLCARSMILDVRESNEPALQLYRGFGFRVIGRRVGYYSNPDEDALVMQKRISVESIG